MSFVKDLNTPLLQLSGHDNFDMTAACNGVHIFGGIGSGKTSGSGRMFAGAYLRAGMGGCVTCVKPEEIGLWQRYAMEHGRRESIVLFDENEGFNFLAYELGRQGMDGIGTVTECLMRVLEAAKKASPTASQKGEEPFWENSARTILRYSIPLVYSATGTLQIGELIRFITSAPTDLKDVTDPEWQKRSFMYEVMKATAHSPKVPMGAAMRTLSAVGRVRRYKAWLAEWNAMGAKDEPAPPPKDNRVGRRRVFVTSAALLLLVIPACFRHLQDNEEWRTALILLWLVACIYLVGLVLRSIVLLGS